MPKTAKRKTAKKTKSAAKRRDGSARTNGRASGREPLAIQLLKLFAPAEVSRDYENRLRAGGLGYGDLKKALFEQYWNFFSAARVRRAELAANRDHVESILRDGAERARVVARAVIKRARKACGLE